MRKILLAVSVSFVLITMATFASGSAQAMTFSTPTAIAAAIDDAALAQDVRLVCERVWRCGAYGCGWTRRCYETRPRWRRSHRRTWRRHRW